MNPTLYPRGLVNSRTPAELPAEAPHFIQDSTQRGTFCAKPELHHAVAETNRLTLVIFGHAHHITLDASDNEQLNSASKIFDTWTAFGTPKAERILCDLNGRYGMFLLSADGSYKYQGAHRVRPMPYTSDKEAAVEFPLSRFVDTRIRAAIQLQIVIIYSRRQWEEITGEADRVRRATKCAAEYCSETRNARDQRHGRTPPGSPKTRSRSGRCATVLRSRSKQQDRHPSKPPRITTAKPHGEY